MKKNELASIKSSQVALAQTKSLIAITDKILTRKNELSTVDENWMYRLWEWADDYYVSEKDIPRNSIQLLKIKEINLASMGISKLPEELFELKGLSELRITADILNEIPDLFYKLENLRILDLSQNVNLETIPLSILKLYKLEELRLFSSNIRKFPEDLVDLKKLKLLDLSYNKIDQRKLKTNQLTQVKNLQ